MTQRLDRIEPRGAACREISEDDAHQGGEAESDKNHCRIDQKQHLQPARRQPGEAAIVGGIAIEGAR